MTAGDADDCCDDIAQWWGGQKSNEPDKNGANNDRVSRVDKDRRRRQNHHHTERLDASWFPPRGIRGRTGRTGSRLVEFNQVITEEAFDRLGSMPSTPPFEADKVIRLELSVRRPIPQLSFVKRAVLTGGGLHIE